MTPGKKQVPPRSARDPSPREREGLREHRDRRRGDTCSLRIGGDHRGGKRSRVGLISAPWVRSRRDAKRPATSLASRFSLIQVSSFATVPSARRAGRMGQTTPLRPRPGSVGPSRARSSARRWPRSANSIVGLVGSIARSGAAARPRPGLVLRPLAPRLEGRVMVPDGSSSPASSPADLAWPGARADSSSSMSGLA